MGQLGQEPTREDFVAHLVMVFAECHRVLKKTGTLWVNLSDTYCTPHKYNMPAGHNSQWGLGKNDHCVDERRVDLLRNRIQGKSLCNIPGLFADEMIRSGWILRNEIIWHKPSVIPSSCRDRFTVDFEKMFFFVKTSKYDFRQQFEPYAESSFGRYKRGRNMSGKNITYHKTSGLPMGKMEIDSRGRNMRAVWRIPTANLKNAHFASYPIRLIEAPIRAGCPEGGVVLDPFMGSGTTAVTARRLKRNYIGFEPNTEYVGISDSRLEKDF